MTHTGKAPVESGSGLAGWLRRPFRGIAKWLRDVSVEDVVDRRNAPAIQLLLIFFGIALPANWVYILCSRPIPADWYTVVALDLLTSLVALGCLVMIRYGAFRGAIKLFLGTILSTQALVYYSLGTYVQLDKSALMLTLVISGLVLGRRAMWVSYLLIQCLFVIGWITDYNNSDMPAEWLHDALTNAPSLPISYGIVAIMLDRTIAALRESLSESEQRGVELRREMLEREQTQQQLIHAQKLEATGRLVSGITHDFNNVLDLVIGFTRQRHMILETGSAAEQLRALEEALNDAEAAAQRGVALTRKLLTFSRNDLLRIDTFDVRSAIAELKPMLKQLFPPGIRLEYQPGETEALIRLDRSEFELMLLNIAANARDAMAGQGCFSIAVSRPSPQWVKIVLADTGPGMDAYTRERMFEPFFSTKESGFGTGLGLSLIRDLMIAADGTIEAESEPGEGARFILNFPFADSSEAETGQRT